MPRLISIFFVFLLAFMPDSFATTAINGYRFDNCGKLAKYKNYFWYRDLASQIAVLKWDENGDLVYNQLTIKDVNESCYSRTGKLVVLVTRSVYGGGGGYVLRYQTDVKKLEKATRSDQGLTNKWFCPPAAFLKRYGDVIEMQSTNCGDAGEGGIDYYNYNYLQNSVQRTRHCITSENGNAVKPPHCMTISE